MKNKNGIPILGKRKRKKKQCKCKEELKIRILNRDGWQCFYCRIELDRTDMTLDHLIPRCKGGKTSERNLVLCCERCNNLKDNMSLEEFSKLLKERNII